MKSLTFAVFSLLLLSGCSSPDGETIIPDGETIILVRSLGKFATLPSSYMSPAFPVQLKEFGWRSNGGIWLGESATEDFFVYQHGIRGVKLATNGWFVMPASEKDLSILLQYMEGKPSGF